MRKDLTRDIGFEPAYDRRDSDPSKNYGIHGAIMRWYLKGPLGAIQFVVYTNWQLPHVTEEQVARVSKTANPDDLALNLRCFFLPTGSDLGYHAPTPQFPGQRRMDKCSLLEQGYCYYDGSSMRAEEVLQLLITEGSEAVWELMEQEYAVRFEGAERIDDGADHRTFGEALMLVGVLLGLDTSLPEDEDEVEDDNGETETID